MISLKKICEVFNISPSPWKLKKIKGYCIDNVLDQSDGVICQSDVPMSAKYNNSNVITISPELLQALINCVIGIINLPPLTAIAGTLTNEYNQAIKTIEKSDNKNRTWEELLKELKC